MSTEFKDHFSDRSQAYRDYRPHYPDELFLHLSYLTAEHERAWDCATGNGQSATALAPYYKEVIATDASENQIQHAKQKPGVIYKVENAEQTSLADSSVDLITVSQALHWLDIDKFAAEAKRVLKPNGILATWTYFLFDIEPQINAIINTLYSTTINAYWPPERRIVEQAYATIEMPLCELDTPRFEMKTTWDLKQVTNYLRTWSAVKRFEADNGFNPVDEVEIQLTELWHWPDQKREINWPLTLKVWQNN